LLTDPVIRPSRSPLCRLIRAIVISFAVLLPICVSTAIAQTGASLPEEIEWTWEVRPPHPEPKLPNVLLLGDSITRNYFPQVVTDLNGIANVYLMAVSTSVGDPRLPRQIAEFATMENVSFRVVHFNNGMHSWAYTEEQYRAAFPDLLYSVRLLAGASGSLIWANITPVQSNAFNGATNPRIDERNKIAQQQVQPMGIPIDDQHSLMMKHLDLYQDTVHFDPAGAAIMGDQAAAGIKTALSK
jgi:hypothetical protein